MPACPIDQVGSGDDCECGHYWSTDDPSKRYCKSKCQANAYPDGNNTCNCNKGFELELDGTTCVEGCTQKNYARDLKSNRCVHIWDDTQTKALTCAALVLVVLFVFMVFMRIFGLIRGRKGWSNNKAFGATTLPKKNEKETSTRRRSSEGK